jgi:heme/copper-type cytochrome/quinol oxidase subunit 2
MDGNNLDIVYPSSTLDSAGYHDIIDWNNPELIPTSSPQSQQIVSLLATSGYLYTIAASIIVAVAVAITVLKFRKRRENLRSKATFSQMNH